MKSKQDKKGNVEDKKLIELIESRRVQQEALKKIMNKLNENKNNE